MSSFSRTYLVFVLSIESTKCLSIMTSESPRIPPPSKDKIKIGGKVCGIGCHPSNRELFPILLSVILSIQSWRYLRLA